MVFRVVDYDNPRAVVLVFGWYAAPSYVVSKYSRLYEQRGCSTITGTVHPLVSIGNYKTKIDKFVKEAIGHAATALRKAKANADLSNKEIPLLIHCFSNTGCRAICRLDKMLEGCSDSDQHDDVHGHDTDGDIRLVKKHLKAQIFDSAPASPTASCKSWRISSPHACFWVNLAGTVADDIDNIIARHQCKDIPEVEYWNVIKYSKTCQLQAFLYSDSDQLCDPKKLEQLISIRQQYIQPDAEILVEKFHDTKHVNHLKMQHDEYRKVIDIMLTKAEALCSNPVVF